MPNLNLNIYNIIILMGILQGLVFSFAILFTKKYYSKTNSFLAYTVLSLSFSNLQYWMIDSNLVKSFPVLGMLRIPCDFLMIPMFYFFVNHYLERKITRRHKLLLCLPFIIDFVFQIINTINTTIFHDQLINHNIVYTYLVIEESFSMCFSAILIILTIRIVNKYERENTNYSFKIVKARTKWLKQILFIGLAVCSFWTIQIYIMMNKGSSGMSIYYPIWICISFIIYWLSYVGLFQSSVLSQRKIIRERLLQKTGNINTIKVPTEKKNIKEQYNDKIFTAFEKIIIESYFNPNLSLEDVAIRLEISSNYLSQIISNRNIRFNDYLNSIRVEKIKLMLKDEKFSGYTITAIGLEAGFNSNASFYRAFKKQTGISPSDYKNE
jgi:AraC-like DNA-binding protein